jgi:hypothetical protein
MKRIIFILLSLIFIVSLGISQTVQFESVLSEVQYQPMTAKNVRSLWILKFENGAIIPIFQRLLDQTKGTIWFIGKKYRVGQLEAKVGYRFRAELIELTGIPEIDKKVKKRLKKQKELKKK